MSEASYGIDSLEVLSPQAHVRLRKGMYVGDAVDPSPLFNEIFDNAIDEAQAGFSPLTEVLVDYREGFYSITDNGRGFPQGMIHNPTTDRDVEALELLCTTAFSGGKFNSNAYRICGGLHGVGLLVTNSLSNDFSITTWRGKKYVSYSANKGETKSCCSSEDDTFEGSGTNVTFVPDETMFESSKIPLNHIIMRCKIASAFGMKTSLTVVHENGNQESIDVTSDIYDLLPPSDEGISEYYRHTFTVKDEETGEFATIALQYTSDIKSYYRGYTNLLYNSKGGAHHKMLDNAIYEAWNKFELPGIKWNDVYLGLRGVVAVFISDAEFSSQSKESLSVNKSKLDRLRLLVIDEIYKWLKENDEVRESLIKRFQEYRSAQNKLLARKEIKSLLYVNESKGGQVRRTSVVRKLRECDSKSREGTELFLVEGDSAMGSALQARDQRTQSLLPLRGKVLNVAKFSDLNSALKNEEVRSIVNSIGSGIGDESDPDRSRYDRIVFMSDADEDGKEIAVLLAGLFINLLPNLVKAGMVFISLPPLYGWKDRRGEFHFTNKQSDIPKGIHATRYKGLGEMDADELRISTMDPESRRLIRLNFPEDLGAFNSILTSPNAKYQMLVDQNVVKYEY